MVHGDHGRRMRQQRSMMDDGRMRHSRHQRLDHGHRVHSVHGSGMMGDHRMRNHRRGDQFRGRVNDVPVCVLCYEVF